MAYIIKTDDKNFCGKGIAGVPFIDGQGKTDSEWIATIAKELGHEVEQEKAPETGKGTSGKGTKGKGKSQTGETPAEEAPETGSAEN